VIIFDPDLRYVEALLLFVPFLYTSAPRTWVPGELVTASMMNTIRDLFLELETGLHEFSIPAAAWAPLPSGGCGFHEDVTSTNTIKGLPFDGTASEGAYCWVKLPKSWNKGTFTAEFETIVKTGSGNFVFSLAGVAVSNDDPISASLGTAQQVTDGITAAFDRLRSPVTAAITVAGSPADGDAVLLVVKRLPGDAADTANGIDVYLTGVTLFLTLNAINDA
jgi:hypothetical protein